MEKMQFLILLFKVMLVSYVVVWAIMLVLCLRKKEFWPIIGDSKTTKYFWLVTFIFLNPALTILYFIFGQIRSPIAKYNKFALPVVVAFVFVGFRLNFPGLGHLWMQPFQGQNKDNAHFRTNLAAINSSNNTTATSYTGNSDNTRFVCKNIVIFSEGEHILLKRVTDNLLEMVKEIPDVETVNYYDEDSLPLTFDFTPDMFIQLNLNDFKENILPYNLKLQTEIQAFIGDTAVKSGHSSIENRTPPSLGYSLKIEVSHNSETNGYESERYMQASKDIAEQIYNHLDKNIKDWKEKYGRLPQIPEEFYGDFKPYEMPEPLKSFGAKQLYSYSGLLKNNETVLQLDIKGHFYEQLNHLKQELIDIGWKDLDSHLYQEDEVTIDNKQNFQIQMKKENRKLYILKRWGDDSAVTVSDSQDPENGVQTCIFIRDVEMFSDEKIDSVLESLFEEPVDMELVMLFERMFNPQQRDKFFELLKIKPLNTLYSKIRLAEMYEGRGMHEEAKQSFLHAKALFWVMPEQSNFRNRLQSLAKKFGDEKLVQQAPEKEVLLEMGAIEVTEDTEPFVIEALPEENVIVFYQKEDGTLRTTCLSCTPLDESNQSFILNSANHSKYNGKGWGTQNSSSLKNGSSVAHNSDYDSRQSFSINCSVTKDKNNDKYLMSFEIYKEKGR